MGWSCLQTQSEAFDKVRAFEQGQEGYGKDNGKEYLFFEFNGNGKDYGTPENPDLELEIYEVSQNQAYRRGTLLLKPDGRIINRSYLDITF